MRYDLCSQVMTKKRTRRGCAARPWNQKNNMFQIDPLPWTLRFGPFHPTFCWMRRVRRAPRCSQPAASHFCIWQPVGSTRREPHMSGPRGLSEPPMYRFLVRELESLHYIYIYIYIYMYVYIYIYIYIYVYIYSVGCAASPFEVLQFNIVSKFR